MGDTIFTLARRWGQAQAIYVSSLWSFIEVRSSLTHKICVCYIYVMVYAILSSTHGQGQPQHLLYMWEREREREYRITPSVTHRLIAIRRISQYGICYFVGMCLICVLNWVKMVASGAALSGGREWTFCWWWWHIWRGRPNKK